MDYTHKQLLVAVGVAGPLRRLRDTRHQSLDITADRCIRIGDLVRRELGKSHVFYRDNEVLPLPSPEPFSDRPDVPIEFTLNPEGTQAFERIAETFILDDHSVLAWCLKCFLIFDETWVTYKITSRGIGICHDIYPFDL